MSKYLNEFAESAKFSSRLSNLLGWVSKTPARLRVLHQIQVFPTETGSGFGLRTPAKIPANEEIVLVSTTKAFTGFELVR